MTDIVKLGLALDPAPMETSSRQVELGLRRVETAAIDASVAVDSLTDAASLNPRGGGSRQGMGAVVQGARDASVGLGAFGNAAELAGKKFETLLKASVGFAAFDLGAKVVGFSSAMDVLGKATDAAAKSLRELLGIEQLEERLKREREIVEANTKAWNEFRVARDAALRSAQGEGVRLPDLGLDLRTAFGANGAAYGRDVSRSNLFLSTPGISSRDEAELRSRGLELQRTAARLREEAMQEINRVAFFGLSQTGVPGVGSPQERQAAVDSIINRVDAQIQSSIDEIRLYAEALNDLSSATKLAAEQRQVEAEAAKFLADANSVSAQQALEASRVSAEWMAQAELMMQRARTQASSFGQMPSGGGAPFLSTANTPEFFGALRDRQSFDVPGYRSPNQDDFRQQRLNDAERLEDEMRRLQEEGRRASQVYKDLGQIGASAFESFLVGARSASDAVKALGADIYLYLVQGLITRPIGNAIAGSLQNAFPSLGANFAQHGATIYQPSMVIPMGGGRPTMIAEAGPERIEPAHARGSGRNSGGRGVTIVVQPREGDNSWRRSMRQVLHDVKRGGL